MDKKAFIIDTKEGVILKLYVQPRAKKERFCGTYGDRLKLAVKAPPVDGKANKAVINFLSKFFNIPKSEICLKSGTASKRKNFLLNGISLTIIQKKFSHLF